MMHPLIAPVLELVQEAGQATLPHWQANVAVQVKADESPVTAADIAAHNVLAAGLATLDSSIPVLSEEDCEIPLSQRKQWTRWWLVDPLDGTKEFISGSDEYTVNVALIERGRVVFGVVGVPVTGSIYYGGAEFGAYCRDKNAETRRLQMRSAPADELVVVASKRHSSPEQEALLHALAQEFPALHLLNVGRLAEVLSDGRRCSRFLSAFGANLAVGYCCRPRSTGRRRGSGVKFARSAINLYCARQLLESVLCCFAPTRSLA